MRQEFKSAGQYFQALAFHGMHPGERVHYGPRAEALAKQFAQLTTGSDEAREVSDSAGGFAVPQSFAADLLQRSWDFSKIAGRCMKLPPIEGNSVRAPIWRDNSRIGGSRLGGVASYWRGETLAATSSIGQFAAPTLTPHPITILIFATEELLMDASTLESTLMLGGSEELAVKLDAAIMGTDSSGADGIAKPNGILDDASLITIAKDQGQAAGTISQTNVTNAVGRLWPYSHPNAIWVCSVSALTAILNSVELNESNLLRFAGADAPDGSPRASLAGFPLVPVEQCQPAGTVGDLVLADFGEYILATKGAPAIANSAEVRFIQHERCFRFNFRVDGHSRWLGAVTSMLESTTVSPFIAIGTRS